MVPACDSDPFPASPADGGSFAVGGAAPVADGAGAAGDVAPVEAAWPQPVDQTHAATQAAHVAARAIPGLIRSALTQDERRPPATRTA
jgi:hypothetical protein